MRMAPSATHTARPGSDFPVRRHFPSAKNADASDFCSQSDSLTEVASFTGIVSFMLPAWPRALVTALKHIMMVSMRLPASRMLCETAVNLNGTSSCGAEAQSTCSVKFSLKQSV
jgi:hypothetical protein